MGTRVTRFQLGLLILISTTVVFILFIPEKYFMVTIPYHPFAARSTPKKCDILVTHENVNFYSKLPAELMQFGVILKRKLSFRYGRRSPGKQALPKSYSYSFELVCCTGTSHCGLVILITERCNGSLTFGGSSFRILFGYPPPQICAFDDYVNGTYIVFCPAPVNECNVVGVDVLYVNYDAYKGNRVPLNSLLWNNSVCPADGGRCRVKNSSDVGLVQRTSLPDVTALRRRVEEQNRFHWRSVKGELRLFGHDINDGDRDKGMHFQTLSDKELCRSVMRVYWLLITHQCVCVCLFVCLFVCVCVCVCMQPLLTNEYLNVCVNNIYT